MRKSKTLLPGGVPPAQAALLLLILAPPAQAMPDVGLLGYVGPGAGLGMIGALLAVLGVIVLGLLGPILYPVRLLSRWYRSRTFGGVQHDDGMTRDAAQPVMPDAEP